MSFFVLFEQKDVFEKSIWSHIAIKSVVYYVFRTKENVLFY